LRKYPQTCTHTHIERESRGEEKRDETRQGLG
jgi:hypothetical protein